ncbi:quinol:cytochrome C oxidoreductase [Psychroflexus sp. CAK57W]|uniref:quinol:cytochrome C oxidoreductase n=1 Tax=Psychroflexus curvus TaxID=2873595 RepID=UPI001CC9E850|nr:quinol:cytochrome C oxidoreductase [Psychroflexus curvus]MBZ9627189.1 quinol:cytochrome C oxidoreductase [Psychroflexus curvus]MBZ9787183.1 quinol:cytochrome C oxidoreductase [Psychroflexus curvus]
MYTMSSKIKSFSLILIVLGAIGLIYSFIDAPSSVEEVKEMLHTENASHGAESVAMQGDHASEDAHADEHAEHIYHQLQNKPWAALYVPALFLFLISLGVFVFYALQNAAQAGWSPVLFRVMEGIASYLVPGGIIVYILLLLSSLHFNHLFVWMDPEVVAHDEIIQNKTAYLNTPFFLIRAAIYMIGWVLFSKLIIKNSRKMDDGFDLRLHKRNFKLSAGFLVFFIVTESMMSWDWIMSIDTHWFSTLFGWFVLASILVSAVTTIALVTIYLKGKGYLENVNNSHIHDLGKFMMGFSIFWAYLWFSQFLLIWYSNIPEEVTYYAQRLEDYPVLFFGTVILNWVLPMLILINSDFKRINWIIVFAGVIILLGNYLNFFVMIMPGTVGESWTIGIPEISSVLLILGLFIFTVFKALAKAPLTVKHNAFLEESKHFHY